MAFLNRVGSLLKKTYGKSTTAGLSAGNASLLQAIRWMSSSKLFVGGLSYNTDEMSLREAFNQYGEVVEARVILDRDTGRSRGFGFVTYTATEDASSAIQALDGQDLHGRRIRVNYATERSRGGFGGGFGGGGGGGGGFGYGDQGGYQGGGGGSFDGSRGDQYPSGGGGYGGGSDYSNRGGFGGGGDGNYQSGYGASDNVSSYGGSDSLGGGYGGSSNFSGQQSGFDSSLRNTGASKTPLGDADEGGDAEAFEDEISDENDKENDYANTRK